MKIDVLGLKQTLLYAQETFAATNGRNRHMSNWVTSGNDIHPEQTEIIMYQTEDGLTKIDVRMENETVWLTGTDGGAVPTRAQRHYETYQKCICRG